MSKQVTLDAAEAVLTAARQRRSRSGSQCALR